LNGAKTPGPVIDLGVWLGGLGLKQYGAAFRENEIDDTVLLSITVEELGFTIATRMKR
jgi:SAM domain (Sterile alpha motif)